MCCVSQLYNLFRPSELSYSICYKHFSTSKYTEIFNLIHVHRWYALNGSFEVLENDLAFDLINAELEAV